MDRLQHSAATATLKSRIEALDAQLTQRDDRIRRARLSSGVALVVGGNLSLGLWWSWSLFSVLHPAAES